jgi:hypothetical protein
MNNMSNKIEFKILTPKQQIELYEMLCKFEILFQLLVNKSILQYGEDYMFDDEWNNSSISLDMEVVSIEIYTMNVQLGFYSFYN